MIVVEGNVVDITGRPVYTHKEAATVGSSNPETQRIVSSVKRAEERDAKVSHVTADTSIYLFVNYCMSIIFLSGEGVQCVSASHVVRRS